MAVPNVDLNKCTLCLKCISLCPFGSVSNENGAISINSSCRACGICVKNCPDKALSFQEKKAVDLSEWKGILVFGEFIDGKLHPVTYELLGKALELSGKCGEPVFVIIAGKDCADEAEKLKQYPCDKILVYDDSAFLHYKADIFTNILEDAITYLKPGIVLVGATPVGRSLAPSAAVRFRTGLTADCTELSVSDKGLLAQIRPAFGGNIMAHIITPYTRPQFATVRYKVMAAAEKSSSSAVVEHRKLPSGKMESLLSVNAVFPKEEVLDIVDSERIVVAGRGVKTKQDMELIYELARTIDAQVAGTRPLIENGWLPANRQIGLSGRTVKPKLIITCGISGAVQFVAGMKSSDTIIAINSDSDAPIFSVADYAVVGDLYKVVPKITQAFLEYEGR